MRAADVGRIVWTERKNDEVPERACRACEPMMSIDSVESRDLQSVSADSAIAAQIRALSEAQVNIIALFD